MINHESNKRPVTLEDLLRLKRAERPSAEFWTEFDRELRAKQLAALVEKRPWWSALPRAFAGLSRYHVPIGATAVLALTIVSVREFRSVMPVKASPVVSRMAAVAAAEPISEPASSAVSHDVESAPAAPTALLNEGDAEARTTALALSDEVAAPADSSQPAETLDTTSAFAPAIREIMPNLAGSSSHSAVGNLVAFNDTKPAFSRDLLGANRGFETRALSASKPKTDPLMQIADPATVRHASLLNASFTGSTVLKSARINPSRGAGRLMNGQFNDSTSRFVASGNTFATKF